MFGPAHLQPTCWLGTTRVDTHNAAAVGQLMADVIVNLRGQALQGMQAITAHCRLALADNPRTHHMVTAVEIYLDPAVLGAHDAAGHQRWSTAQAPPHGQAIGRYTGELHRFTSEIWTWTPHAITTDQTPN